MMIGKFVKPISLDNLNMNLLPVFYRSQNKSWMTLFNECLGKQFVPCVKMNCHKEHSHNVSSHPSAIGVLGHTSDFRTSQHYVTAPARYELQEQAPWIFN